ncbi:MAG: hypothetical protein IMZ69_00980 [Spirochaetes bacterium]|nr:hypothetical protein [Spirochaetota bacterium]
MKRRTRITFVVIAALVVVCAGAVLAAQWLRTDTTLEFKVRDSMSGKWVWDAAMKLQGRTIVGYYQSDAAPLTYRFTRLTPGKATLEIAADSYQPVGIPLTLKRGANRLERPIDMIGLAIPDLTKFYIFESREAGDIVAEIRPVNSTGTAVLNHPCMDLWMGCRISVQMMSGVPAREEAETGSSRGSELYRGRISWKWDPAPETQFRYSARIPGAQIKDDPSAYRVIDYLIVVPDPLAISSAELEKLLARVYAMDDTAAVEAALDAEKDRLRYFIDTSWNVKARQE